MKAIKSVTTNFERKYESLTINLPFSMFVFLSLKEKNKIHLKRKKTH